MSNLGFCVTGCRKGSRPHATATPNLRLYFVPGHPIPILLRTNNGKSVLAALCSARLCSASVEANVFQAECACTRLRGLLYACVLCWGLLRHGVGVYKAVVGMGVTDPA